MNKKRLTITILILMIAVMGFATTIDPTDPTPSVPKTTEQTLNIYGYKVADFNGNIIFELTDALSNSIDRITNNSAPLDLTPYKNEFLSSEDKLGTEFDLKLAFSYRLAGQLINTPGYTIKVEATPFLKDGKESYISDDKKVIDNYIIFENHLMQFYRNGSLVDSDVPSQNENENQGKYIIQYESTGNDVNKSTDGTKHFSVVIEEKITIQAPNSDSNTPPSLTGDDYWLARAGIAMGISAVDFYENAEKGLYISTVTVTMTPLQ